MNVHDYTDIGIRALWHTVSSDYYLLYFRT